MTKKESQCLKHLRWVHVKACRTDTVHFFNTVYPLRLNGERCFGKHVYYPRQHLFVFQICVFSSILGGLCSSDVVWWILACFVQTYVAVHLCSADGVGVCLSVECRCDTFVPCTVGLFVWMFRLWVCLEWAWEYQFCLLFENFHNPFKGVLDTTVISVIINA